MSASTSASLFFLVSLFVFGTLFSSPPSFQLVLYIQAALFVFCFVLLLAHRTLRILCQALLLEQFIEKDFGDDLLLLTASEACAVWQPLQTCALPRGPCLT